MGEIWAKIQPLSALYRPIQFRVITLLLGLAGFVAVCATGLTFAYNAAGRGCKTGNSQAAHFGTVTLEFGEQVRHIKMNMLGRVRVCDPRAQATGCSATAD